MTGKRQGMVVEAEEQLLCGGGGFTIRSRRMEVEDRPGRQGCSFFLFLVGLNPTLNPTV
jgi:hypothetical protein